MDELCNYVRIEAGRHPGITNISIPDFFDCMDSTKKNESVICTTSESTTVADSEGKFMVSQTCQIATSMVCKVNVASVNVIILLTTIPLWVGHNIVQ